MLRRLLLTLALTIPATVLTPHTVDVHADQGLSIATSIVYTIDADASVVHVVVELSLTNQLPDVSSANSVSRSYFYRFSVPAPTGSARVVGKTAAGGRLAVSARTVPNVKDFLFYDITFDSRLYYRQTTHLRLTYDITDLPPRSANPTRVNPAYAAFDAFGEGDPGHVTIQVVVPDGFVVNMLGSDTTSTHHNGTTTYTATNIPNPKDFDVFVSARRDAALTATTVTTKQGERFDLRSWPNDTAWQTFVSTQITTGVPELSTLIGQPWPIDGTVTVRQAFTPYLYGYAGWFSAVQKELEVGEDLDSEVVLHELSHAWFSKTWFADRWLNEGLAQVYSNRAVTDLGGTPKPATTPDVADKAKVSLNDWGDPNFVTGADQVEAYGYNAAYFVTDRIVKEIGDDKMRKVFQMVADRTTPYAGAGTPETLGGATDWRRFLDLVDEVGATSEADHLMLQYVVAATSKDTLAERDAARAKYHALVAHGSTWAAPLVVRRTMADWAFVDATKGIAGSEHALTLRDRLDPKAASLGTPYPDSLRHDYEGADKDLSKVTTEIQQQIDSADLLLDAVSADGHDHGFLGGIGLRGEHLSAVIADAKAAFQSGDNATAQAEAKRVLDTLRTASSVGLHRLLYAIGGVVLVLLAVWAIIMFRRRRRRRRADAETSDQMVESPVDTPDDTPGDTPGELLTPD